VITRFGLSYGLCACASQRRIVAKLLNGSSWFFFGLKVTTQDSYFVLDGNPDPPTERNTFPGRGSRTWKIALLLSTFCSFKLSSAFPYSLYPAIVISAVAELLLIN